MIRHVKIDMLIYPCVMLLQGEISKTFETNNLCVISKLSSNMLSSNVTICSKHDLWDEVTLFRYLVYWLWGWIVCAFPLKRWTKCWTLRFQEEVFVPSRHTLISNFSSNTFICPMKFLLLSKNGNVDENKRRSRKKWWWFHRCRWRYRTDHIEFIFCRRW